MELAIEVFLWAMVVFVGAGILVVGFAHLAVIILLFWIVIGSILDFFKWFFRSFMVILRAGSPSPVRMADTALGVLERPYPYGYAERMGTAGLQYGRPLTTGHVRRPQGDPFSEQPTADLGPPVKWDQPAE